VPLLFTENASNEAKLFGERNEGPFVKDGINDHVVLGRPDAVNPAQTGTKAAAHYRLDIPAGQTRVVRLRLTDTAPAAGTGFGTAFDDVVATRLREADAFYDAISPPSLSADERAVMRQALAGMLWSKQYYFFDLDTWLASHGPTCSTSTSSSARTASARCRATTWTSVRLLGGRRGISRRLRAGRVEHGSLRRKLELARSDLDADERLIIRALLQLYAYYGDACTVECPTGSGRRMTLFEVAREIGRRLGAIFLRGPDGRRPVFGDVKKFQTDPSWRDHLQFYEYFHGDNGAGIGANHQTGWTGLVAKVLQLFGTTTSPSSVIPPWRRTTRCASSSRPPYSAPTPPWWSRPMRRLAEPATASPAGARIPASASPIKTGTGRRAAPTRSASRPGQRASHGSRCRRRERT
jgi:hypothetical protein